MTASGRYAVAVDRSGGGLTVNTRAAVERHLIAGGASPRHARKAATMVLADHVGPGVQTVALTHATVAGYLRLALREWKR